MNQAVTIKSYFRKHFYILQHCSLRIIRTWCVYLIYTIHLIKIKIRCILSGDIIYYDYEIRDIFFELINTLKLSSKSKLVYFYVKRAWVNRITQSQRIIQKLFHSFAKRYIRRLYLGLTAKSVSTVVFWENNSHLFGKFFVSLIIIIIVQKIMESLGI